MDFAENGLRGKWFVFALCTAYEEIFGWAGLCARLYVSSIFENGWFSILESSISSIGLKMVQLSPFMFHAAVDRLSVGRRRLILLYFLLYEEG
jgi:hypothetical protein